MLICIEGTDSSGKATQTKLLTDRLTARLTDRLQPSVLYSFHRYATPLGALIKRHLLNRVALREKHSIDSADIRIDGDTVYRVAPEDPMMFQCLATIDKYDAANDIRSALATGVHVVCDRYLQSAVAYGMADGLDETWLRRIQSSLPQPDLNIFIDVSEEEALRRRPDMRDRYERDREKQKRVREIYQQLWKTGGPGRWITVDGAGSVEEVHAAIWLAVEQTHVVGSGRSLR